MSFGEGLVRKFFRVRFGRCYVEVWDRSGGGLEKLWDVWWRFGLGLLEVWESSAEALEEARKRFGSGLDEVGGGSEEVLIRAGVNTSAPPATPSCFHPPPRLPLLLLSRVHWLLPTASPPTASPHGFPPTASPPPLPPPPRLPHSSQQRSQQRTATRRLDCHRAA